MRTYDELRNEIWIGLGKPTDLDPSTDTTYNGGPYLNWIVNEAQRQIATWKDPRTNCQTRFRELFGELNYQTTVTSDTVNAVNNSTFPYYIDMNGSAVGAQDDRYNGWLIVIGGIGKTITDYDGSNYRAYIGSAFTATITASTSVSLYKNFEYLLPSTHAWISDHITLPSETDKYRGDGNLIEPLKIYDLYERREIENANRSESFIDYLESTGDPREWYMRGNKIYYDLNVDSSRWMKMEYYRMPMEMSADADTPEIPEQFHYAIILWGLLWGYRRMQESGNAYSTEKQLENYMRSTVGNYDIAADRQQPGAKMRGDYFNVS